ncbi:MAG: membrane-bound lytic murein transglycosylase F [Halopseudomonas sp.]|jgi:membrane-bound lytic murein transglycosylase F|uniref:membrane-bound lytic murein transglycosylase MltF n=1 Tax=Halopseudomonas sp. TaxID=2901191 RepID=UPI0039E713E0
MREATRIGILLALSLLLVNCSSDDRLGALPHPDETGVLTVSTRNGSTTFYTDRDEQPSGPEYDLVNQFAEARGWAVDWDVQFSTAAVLQQLAKGRAHIGAAGLTRLASRDERFTPGPVHNRVREQLICNRHMVPLPTTLAKLEGVEIKVVSDSSYVETLKQLANENPAITFTQTDKKGTEQLLVAVFEQKLECTVADSNIVDINRRSMPSLAVVMELSPDQEIGWYLPKGSDRLAASAHEWMSSAVGISAIARVDAHYYAYISEFDFVDLNTLVNRIENRLPRYRDEFEQAEVLTGMPADLLAALSYQESHWDPHARSATGVRGLMMLTQNTAKSLGVTDRLDPEQSIDGGARYLARRYELLSEKIPDPDRVFLALASYNVGRGHLLDAQKLALELGKNPDSWSDMREILPLLADKRYYPQLRYGYARGYEPVHFVQRVRNYRDVISVAFQ